MFRLGMRNLYGKQATWDMVHHPSNFTLKVLQRFSQRKTIHIRIFFRNRENVLKLFYYKELKSLVDH